MTSNRPTSPATSAGKPRGSSSERTDKLFLYLQRAYGNVWLDRWTGQRLEDVKATWAAELEPFDDVTVRLAVKSLAENHPEFPPSLPALVDLCKQARPQPAHRPAAIQIADKRPPRPETMQKIGGILDGLRKKAGLL